MTNTAHAIFPSPDHDHERCASAAIAHAEAQCAARAQRLTPMRRQVLQALLSSHKPLGAYEIIDRLAQRSRPAPITIYRALDFL
ncbi:MAG: transcriptional repressor, partial [Xanthobacteraceae bacterium]